MRAWLQAFALWEEIDEAWNILLPQKLKARNGMNSIQWAKRLAS